MNLSSALILNFGKGLLLLCFVGMAVLLLLFFILFLFFYFILFFLIIIIIF